MLREKAKMLAGELYDARDPELSAERRRAVPKANTAVRSTKLLQ